MISADTVLGWVLIGAAASLAGMIWAFRRGALGVVANLLAGMLGALAGGFLSDLVLPGPTHGGSPARLLFAAVGAVAVLAAVHLVWLRIAARRPGLASSPSTSRAVPPAKVGRSARAGQR